ncbi:MAG: hypothetical protein KatS3mg087_1847 [Patescibacteria group bacterium]|nr:MAG: hypothetical protein KatS3mg087_1847 [Patescibacteria group bacterium]
MQSYVDDGTYGNKGRLYIPGQTGNSYGVVCVDLEALANCGFTSLGTSGAGVPGNENPVLLSGFVENEGKLYGHANDADRAKQTVICYDLNSDGNGSDAPCADYSETTEAFYANISFE